MRKAAFLATAFIIGIGGASLATAAPAPLAAAGKAITSSSDGDVALVQMTKKQRMMMQKKKRTMRRGSMSSGSMMQGGTMEGGRRM